MLNTYSGILYHIKLDFFAWDVFFEK